MNFYDDHYIVEMEIVAKVSVGFAVPNGTILEAVESRMSSKELIENIYDIDTVEFIGVEQD